MSNNYPAGQSNVIFQPATNEDERPAVRVDETFVFVYRDDDGAIVVTVDTEDCGDRQPYIRLNVNNGTMWEGAPGDE